MRAAQGECRAAVQCESDPGVLICKSLQYVLDTLEIERFSTRPASGIPKSIARSIRLCAKLANSARARARSCPAQRRSGAAALLAVRGSSRMQAQCSTATSGHSSLINMVRGNEHAQVRVMRRAHDMRFGTRAVRCRGCPWNHRR